MSSEPSSASHPTLYTVGHSNVPFAAFAGLLAQHSITVLVDVRTSPYSAYAPQFNGPALAAALGAHGIRYRMLGDALGGRPADPACYDAEGHVCYDRVAASAVFQAGLARLRQGLVTVGAAGGRLAICCSEEDPTDCHRRLLVTRVLVGAGVPVCHLRHDGRVESEAEVAARATPPQLGLFGEVAAPWRSVRAIRRLDTPTPASLRPLD